MAVLSILGWVAAGLLVGFIATKFVNLRGDDPRLGIGVSLGAPAYVAPAPVYVRPAAPVYGAPYYRHEAPRWHGGYDHDHDYGRYNRAGWNHGGYGNNWGHRG